MKPFWALFRLMFSEYFAVRRLLGTNQTQSKKKTVLLVLLIVYALGTLLFSFGFLFFQLGSVLAPIQQIKLLIGFIIMYLTFFTVFFTILRADGFLFHFRDYELIAPLRLKPCTILLARMLVMMTMLLAILLIITLPMVN